MPNRVHTVEEAYHRLPMRKVVSRNLDTFVQRKSRRLIPLLLYIYGNIFLNRKKSKNIEPSLGLGGQGKCPLTRVGVL